MVYTIHLEKLHRDGNISKIKDKLNYGASCVRNSTTGRKKKLQEIVGFVETKIISTEMNST
jgi:hypothetical protein